jgi:hypothetical protein
MIPDSWMIEVPHLADRQLGLDRLDALGLNARSGSRIYRAAATQSSLTRTRHSNTRKSGRSRPEQLGQRLQSAKRNRAQFLNAHSRSLRRSARFLARSKQSMCQLCSRTPVSDVPGLYNKPGDDQKSSGSATPAGLPGKELPPYTPGKPSTMYIRDVASRSRTDRIFLYSGETRQACAFSKLSNAEITMRPLGGSPSMPTLRPPRTR